MQPMEKFLTYDEFPPNIFPDILYISFNQKHPIAVDRHMLFTVFQI